MIEASLNYTLPMILRSTPVANGSDAEPARTILDQAWVNYHPLTIAAIEKGLN